MKRKGISLTLETIVVLILAITVLTVVLYFFSSNFLEAGRKTDYLSAQRDGCFAYAQADPSCSGDPDTKKPVRTDESQMKKLYEACQKLNYFSCAGATEKNPSLQCIADCCKIFCLPAKATDCKGSCVQTSACPGEPAEGTCPSGQICCK